MSNPVLARSDYFNGRRAGAPQVQPNGYQPNQFQQNQYQAPQFQSNGYQDPRYANPQFANADNRGGYGQYGAPSGRGLMTFEDVITKTAISLGAVALVAVLSAMFLPPELLLPAVLVSGLVGMVTVIVVSLRQRISPVALGIYALVEGVFVGSFSAIFEQYYPGIVIQAVIGTFAAAALTLGAYKFFNIRVTDKFRKVVFIGTAAFALTMLVNFGISMFTHQAGLRGGWIGLAVCAVAIVLAVLNLITDFDYVERGVAAGAPASESWRAALGFTVTMVWLYTELIRLLSYFRN